jgi:heme/copper-type cytochrome/quinol oxidase subunit 1
MIRNARHELQEKYHYYVITLGFIEMHMHLHPRGLNIHERRLPGYNNFQNVAPLSQTAVCAITHSRNGTRSAREE